MLIWYSQEARSYALLIFFGALSFLFFVRSLETRRGRDLALWAVTSALALGSHYFAFFAVGIEAVKAVSELYAPLAGTVTEVNATLQNDPALVNRDPYGAGWMIKLRVKTPAELDQLLSAEAYKKQIGQ